MASSTMELKQPKVVSHTEWLNARKDYLTKEKEFTRLRDELSRQRLQLPWEKVEKQYVFEGPNGQESLADLFGKRSQLIIYLHAGSRLERGLPELLAVWPIISMAPPIPSGESRRYAGCGFACARWRRSKCSKNVWDGAFRGSRRSRTISTGTTMCLSPGTKLTTAR